MAVPALAYSFFFFLLLPDCKILTLAPEIVSCITLNDFSFLTSLCVAKQTGGGGGIHFLYQYLKT